MIASSVFKEGVTRDFKRELYNINNRYWKIDDNYDFEIKGRRLLSPRKIKNPKYQSYVEELLYLCKKYEILCIATFRNMPKGSSQTILQTKKEPILEHLSLCFRRLIERVSMCVNDSGEREYGIILYDALDKSRCETIARSMTNYMFRTEHGHKYSNVLPTPYFVDSKITDEIQIADLFAYIICAQFSGRKEPEIHKHFNFIKKYLMYVSNDGNIRGFRNCEPQSKSSDPDESDDLN